MRIRLVLLMCCTVVVSLKWCCIRGQAFEENQAAEDIYVQDATDETDAVDDSMPVLSEDYSIDDAYVEIYKMLQLDAVEKELARRGFNGSLDFKSLIQSVQNDNTKGIVNAFLSMISGYLFQDIASFKALMIEVISVVLLGSIFIHLSNSFGNGFVSENGFYVAYLIITSILLAAFSLSMQMVHQTLQKLVILVQIIAPVYALSMQYLGHPLTATGMYELITIGIFIVQIIILKFVLPMIQFYVVTAMINNLNKEDTFSKLCRFVQFVVRWILKTVIVVIAGLNIIKSLIEPQMDELSKRAVSKLIASVPGGGIVSVLTGTFLGAGAIIKNCIGAVGIVLIVGLLMIPLLKAFLMMLFAKVTAVIIQPIGEKRFVEGVETLADGMKLLLQAMASSIVLFVLTIAIMAFASKGGT